MFIIISAYSGMEIDSIFIADFKWPSVRMAICFVAGGATNGLNKN
jgi:hypothetical protein